MSLLRTLLILVLALTITAEASAAKAKKKKNSGLEGIVTAIESGTEEKKDTGTITLKVVAGKKKKNAAPAGNEPEKKIQVTKETTFEKVSGKKGQQEAKPASFSDLQKDSRVRITTKAGTDSAKADKVQIVDGKKKKKNKAS